MTIDLLIRCAFLLSHYIRRTTRFARSLARSLFLYLVNARQLVPFVDCPFSDWEAEAMKIVHFFRGVPVSHLEKGLYKFPHLVDESLPGRDADEEDENDNDDNDDNGDCKTRICAAQDFFYSTTTNASGTTAAYRTINSSRSWPSLSSSNSSTTAPLYLKEGLYRLTKLEPLEFWTCVGLGLVNLAGTYYLDSADIANDRSLLPGPLASIFGFFMLSMKIYAGESSDVGIIA